MPPVPKTRAERAAAARARMPQVPCQVVDRVCAAFEVGDFPERGVFAALDDFFGHLAREELAFEEVLSADFRVVGRTRTRLRTLLWGLRRFAPEVPLAAAGEAVQEWDRWLNSRYNVKPTKARQSTRVATAPEEWPDTWQATLPLLDQSLWIGETRHRRLAPKTRAAVVQAVGMAAAARSWAAERGVVLGENVDADTIEVLSRYLLGERRVTPRTAADYLERVRVFAGRGSLLDAEARAALREIVGALREEAGEADPGKREKVRAFRRRFTLADVMHKAIELTLEADEFPAYTAAAIRRRRDAVILALLVNTADRQGDLSRHRIGVEMVRHEDGLWEPLFRQSKTGRTKENGSLWRLTSELIDRHILADRPAWLLADRLTELHGRNLLSLEEESLGLYHPSRVLRAAFGISGHLVRTLITDAIRVSRPDAAWAAQFLLGHGTREMQEVYRTQFAELGAIQKYHDTMADLIEQAEAS